MNFLVPTLLAGLIGVVIPVAIHLLFRRRARRVRWAAMQFLGSVSAPSLRMSRWKFWLLMACRIGVVAALTLALARPQVTARFAPTAWLRPRPVNITLIIDHSVSSTRITDGQSTFDRSLEIADQVLQDLRPTDSAAVIIAERAPRMLDPGLVHGGDSDRIAALRQALHAPMPGPSDSSIPRAISAAKKALDTVPPAENVVLVLAPADRNAWQPDDRALWQSVYVNDRESVNIYSLVMPPVTDFTDAAVTDLRIDPPLLGKSHPLHILCTITNLGTKGLAPTISHLFIDGVRIDTRSVPARAPKGSAELDFALPQGISRTGPHRIRVALDVHDSVAADDEALGVVDVLEPLPVLIVDGAFSSAGDGRSSGFLGAALHPDDLSVLNPKVIPLSDLPTTPLVDFAAVIFNDCPTLPPSVREELIPYTRAGHGVWFILGPRTPPDFVTTNLVTSGLFPCQPQSIQASPAPGLTAVVKDPSHPIVTPITSAGGNPFTGSYVRNWWSVMPTDPSTQVLVATPSGEPLIMSHPVGSSGGSILLWTTSADGSWNNWNLMPNFVPLAIESAFHLALPPPTRHPLSLIAGQPIEFSAPSDRPFAVATLTAPDGSRTSKSPTAVDNRLLVTFPDTFLPGFYTLTAGQETNPFAVNPDPRQLSPAPMTPQDVRGLAETQKVHSVDPSQLDAVVHPRADRLELSQVLGILLLAILVLETAVAMAIARQNGRGPADCPKQHFPIPEAVEA